MTTIFAVLMLTLLTIESLAPKKGRAATRFAPANQYLSAYSKSQEG